MTKEKITPAASPQDVWPAVAAVLGRYDLSTFTDAPAVMQQMFEDILEHESGDSLRYRQRILMTLYMIRDFAGALQPFSEDVINQAIQ